MAALVGPLETVTLRQVRGAKRPWVASVAGPRDRKPTRFVDGVVVSRARSGNASWEFEITEPGFYRVHEEWYGRVRDDVIEVREPAEGV